MKQYYPEAEMCLEVNISNINNETQEDNNMVAKNTTTNNTPATTENNTKDTSVSIDWKGIYNKAKEHLSNGYTKGKEWTKEHPKHTAIGIGVLVLAAMLKLRSKKSDNKK